MLGSLNSAIMLRAASRRLLSTATFQPPRKVNLAAAFAKINEPWSPHVAGDVNECQLKLARMQGSFVWHHHELEDECFLVVRGQMRMLFRGEGGDSASETAVDCHEGELIVVPKGVEHCPVALTETCDVLLVERGETLNTGSAAEEIGDFAHQHGSKPLTKRDLERVA